MKKVFYPFVLLLAASIIFTGCRSDDDDLGDIVVSNPGSLEQIVYADEETGASGVSFTALAPWTSSIRDVSATRSTANWVSISPESGGAGTYTITISLEPNLTAIDRSAIIAITGGGATIEIRITQQGEGGAPPEDHSIIRAQNITGDVDDVVTVKAITAEGEFIAGEASFQNRGFTLQLNSVPETFLMSGEWPNDITVSDRDVKIAVFQSVTAFDREGDRVTGFMFGNQISENESHWAVWVYADRDVTISGTHRGEDWEESIGVRLRRGWNIVYVYEYYNESTGMKKLRSTTIRPPGVNFRWELGQNDWLDEYPRDAVTPDLMFSTPESVEQFMNRIREQVNEVQNLYYELDNQFPTLTSRMRYLTPETPAVSQFWQRSYQTIRSALIFLTVLPEHLERHPNADVEKAFLANKGEVLVSKGLMYFYLNTKFGGVPIVQLDDFNNPNFLHSRASWSEVSELIRATLFASLYFHVQDEGLAARRWQTLALIALQKGEYLNAASHLMNGFAYAHNSIPIRLLYAEAILKWEGASWEARFESIRLVNQVLQELGKELLPLDATEDEILAMIKANFPNENTGMKYINAIRWGTWGAEWDGSFRKFLPIPWREIMINPNMKQNPGW